MSVAISVRIPDNLDKKLEWLVHETERSRSLEVQAPGHVACQIIPEPRPFGKLLLEKAAVTLPDAISCKGAAVVTRKKLVSERKSF